MKLQVLNQFQQLCTKRLKQAPEDLIELALWPHRDGAVHRPGNFVIGIVGLWAHQQTACDQFAPDSADPQKLYHTIGTNCNTPGGCCGECTTDMTV